MATTVSSSVPSGQPDRLGIVRWHVNGQLHRVDGPAVVHLDGTEEWYFEGQRHRDGGPAVTCPGVRRRGLMHGGFEKWYRAGMLHREDGPAIISHGRSEEWFREGLLHREGGPAITRPEGMEGVVTTRWYSKGEIHRDDGPAMEDANGTKLYFRHGKLHRDDGPARILPEYRTADYWLNGTRVSEQRFQSEQPAPKVELPKSPAALRPLPPVPVPVMAEPEQGQGQLFG